MVPGVPGVPGSRRRGASALFLALLVLSSCHRGASESDLRGMYDQANLAFLHGELTEAQAIAERGLAQAGPQADSEWSWRFRLLRGDILISGRNLSEVRALVHAALPPRPPNRCGRNRPFSKPACCWRIVVSTLPCHSRSMSLRSRLATSSCASMPNRWPAISSSRQDGGMRARRCTGTVRAASEARDRYHEAFALHQLGMGQLVRNRFDQALALFERVLAFSDLSATSIYAKALNNAGICYSRLGQFERAIVVQRRAVDPTRKASQRRLRTGAGAARQHLPAAERPGRRNVVPAARLRGRT